MTYEFYTQTYLGSAIAATAFDRLAARGEAWLQALERSCSVTACGPDSRAMAVCALAECIQRMEKQYRVSQTSVGGVSIRYQDDPRSRDRQLLEAAGVYLDICRGVE